MTARHPAIRPFGHGGLRAQRADEAARFDERSIRETGVPQAVLMENAGRSAAAVLVRLFGAGRVTALVGAGNNGGDGFVLVRHLFAEGVPCEAILIGAPERLPPDAAANWRRLEAIDAPRRTVPPDSGRFDWAALLEDTSVAVDALFGTGLTRPLAGVWAEVEEACVAARRAGVVRGGPRCPARSRHGDSSRSGRRGPPVRPETPRTRHRTKP